MKIAKVREVRTPERGTSLSAGIDFFIPKFDDDFIKEFEKYNPKCYFVTEGVVIPQGESVLIPSGIEVNFEGEPKALIAFNKGGVFVNGGLQVGACVVDQDYQTEVFISLLNKRKDSQVILKEGDKIVQFILTPVLYEDIEVVQQKYLWSGETERGNGKLGSTNK